MGSNNHIDSTAARDEQSLWQDDDGPEPSTTDSSELHIRSSLSSDIEDARLPLPIWMQESSKSFCWKWVPLPIRKISRSIIAWSKGPQPPVKLKIAPFYAFIQEAPLRILDRYLPRRVYKAALLVVTYFCWFLTFSLVLHRSANSGSIEGYGQPQPLWCGASYWSGGNSCGIDGNNCRPFDDATLAFKCPADCKSVIVLNPRAVGDQEVSYETLVIGGPADDASGSNFYRGDSFLCQAAIHAGVINNADGGCGVVSLSGRQESFSGSKRHGIQSFGFDASFPQSYTFISGISSNCGEVDLRWPLLAVTVIFTTMISIFTSSPAVFFASLFTMLFFHVGLVSDKPNIYDYPSLSSLMVERFLPSTFVAFVIYKYCVKPQLSGLTAQIEKSILWLGGAWVGALNNYTFDRIPIQRLTPHDLRAQPGAVPALATIVVLIFVIALGQIWYLRLEGRLRRYLAIYTVMGSFLVICVIIPTLSLRIHHYVLAILLLPGTGIQTRTSLLYQGILVGLFINGVARWGFDSILQTEAALIGDGQLDSLLPNLTTSVVGVASATFGWALPPAPYDGISVLVNDVERHRWYYGEGGPSYTRERHGHVEKEYFRFGYMRGSGSADYTRAGVWDVDGSWRTMKPGPSR